MVAGFLRVVAVAAAALVVPATAWAGALTLHPAGFGQHSYAAWKAHEGQPDSHGNADEALLFQKDAPTPTFAAGVAVIEGIAGTPASELTGLAWDHREDGHCGAGAPRWNVTYRDSGGMEHTLFLGCNAAVHTEHGFSSGHGWCRDREPSPAAIIPDAAHATITGLAIVFDEGNDTANPPPAGCRQDQPAGGFVHLDNITVEINGFPHCWTAARDNSVNGVNNCDLPAGELDVPPLSPLVGVPVDPSDTELVTGLDDAYPGVATSDWLLYPDVY